MEKITYINNIEHLPAPVVAKGIREKIVTFEDLQATGRFYKEKQDEVKAILRKYVTEDNAFNDAVTKSQLNDFLVRFPQSEHCETVKIKITQIVNEERNKQQRIFEEIKANINEYKPDEIKLKLGEDLLRSLCDELGLDYNVVDKYDEANLKFGDIPKNREDVPSGYTDVFFWGIPSSGKTCALAAIFRTIKDNYNMASPTIEKKYGVTYRDSLVNVFKNNLCYLPSGTVADKTQYMPFLLKRKNEKDYRKISFFELSGEVFKYFYEIQYDCKILNEEKRADVESSFHTLELLLNSNNQKIHFFFIDYKQETKGYVDNSGLTQDNYLDAAATYFRDKNDIFKRKTDAVFVVVTKSDEIKGNDKPTRARKFLDDNFFNFMGVIEDRCKKDSVSFSVKVFSIGDVYFRGICKLDPKYSKNIVEDLLKTVKPVSENWLSRLLRS